MPRWAGAAIAVRSCSCWRCCALAGPRAALRLPVALFPHVNFPRIAVNVDAGDRPAEQMVIEVTRPVEQAVRAVPGVRSVRSTTSRGSAESRSTSPGAPTWSPPCCRSSRRSNQILPRLPAGTQLRGAPHGPDRLPGVAYSLTSDSDSPGRAARPRPVPAAARCFRPINGVARVGVHGRRAGGIPRRRRSGAAAGLRPDHATTWSRALSASNVLQAVGRLRGSLQALPGGVRHAHPRPRARSGTRCCSSGAERRWCALEDVATVRPGHRAAMDDASPPTATTPCLLQVYQQPGGNTVQIVAGHQGARWRDCRAQAARGRADRQLV